MSSYGLPLLGVLALAVLWLARSWRPLPVAAVAALAVVLAFAALGFAWWEAYPVLRDRYWDGIATTAPGVVLGLGQPRRAARLGADRCSAPGSRSRARRAPRRRADRRACWPARLRSRVAIADLSRMSKAEVERIWLPFVPWLTLSLALLPGGWRRWGLALQVVDRAAWSQHLLYTTLVSRQVAAAARWRSARSPSSGADLGGEAQLARRQRRRGDHVADVAGPEAAGDLGRDVAAGALGDRAGDVEDRDRAAGADVVRRRSAARLPATTDSRASTLARATSSTCTKSRTWPPSSKTCGASPRSRDERNIAATPE